MLYEEVVIMYKATDIANWLLFFADISPWAVNTYYVANACVIEDGKLYQCNTAHTSDATTFSNDIANWTLIAGGGTSIEDWQASTSYSVGDLVIVSNNLYRCKTAHTSASTFVNTNWDLIGSTGTEIQDWTASTSYAVGDFVIHSNNIYKCITANNDATWTAANWQLVGSGSDFVGATSSVNGTQGLVPAPQAGEENKFLKADGTWANIISSGVNIITDELWSGTINSVGTGYTFNKDYTQYDYLLFETGFGDDTTATLNAVLCPVRIGNVLVEDFSVSVGALSGSNAVIRAYDILPQSTTTFNVTVSGYNDNNFIIRKIEGITFVNPNVYSATEKRVGTWIDGKPLYQKTINCGTIPSSAANDIIIYNEQGDFELVMLIEDASFIIIPYTSGSHTAYTYNRVNMLYDIDTKTYNAVYVNVDEGELQTSVKCTNDFIGCTLIITVRYTKVAD